MAENGSVQSPKINYRQLTSSIFTAPRLFTGLVSKGCNETESSENSPTSILDSKSFSGLKNSIWPESNAPKPECRKKFESKPGLVDALIDEESGPNSPKPETRMILFGSQLKIQVPPLPPSLISPVESPKSPGDFGIKTRNSFVGPFSPGLSPSPVRKSPFGSSNSGAVTSLSASEMELSEDYTCVISYGPNPRITHIFDDCIVESCCGVVKSSELRKGDALFSNRPMSYPSESFLSFCYNCKKNLGQGKDIYMYRGEKAFCSSECRYKEMMLEEEEEEEEEEEVEPETLDSDDIYGTSS